MSKNRFCIPNFKFKLCASSKKNKNHDYSYYGDETKQEKSPKSTQMLTNSPILLKKRLYPENVENYDYTDENIYDLTQANFLDDIKPTGNQDNTSGFINSNILLFATQSTVEELNDNQMQKDENDGLALNAPNNDSLYVCCIAYTARFEGDIDLNFSDRVKLIHANQDYALVKNILNDKCGYVPVYCIQTITKFLDQIKYY